ncbi:unnamed protein product [Durusdinium trenchii]|uniref:Uncharacterized protein n=1 Tax=Durusdinium trenchii TaxID=1381693 RepID=A0ABP0QNL3_9DINO
MEEFSEVSTGAIQSVKSTMSNLEGKIGELEQNLQDPKAAAQTSVLLLLGAVHDKVGAGQMQQLKSIVGAEQMQQVKTTAQLTSYEQQLREKAPAAQLQGPDSQGVTDLPWDFGVEGLKAVLAALEGKLTNCEQALQEKVDAAWAAQLAKTQSCIHTPEVGNIERGVWEGMDCVQGLEGALTTLKGQVATVEHNLQEKVCSEDVQRLGDVVISLKGKVGSLEQNFRQGAEHVTDVEGAVVSIGKQLATVKQALDFLDCPGEHFEPRWSSFQALLPASVTPETPLSEAQLNEAADLVDTLEEVDWAEVVSAFSSRLRGELTTEQLGGFCLFGAVTAYTVVAYHLARGAGDDPIPSTAKNLLARSLMILAKKQVNDFLESSWWPVRSLDVVALLELEDFQQVRNLRFEMPCWLRLGCSRPDMEERALLPPAPPLEASWPSNVVAVGLHTTSTLEVVTALRDAITESWGRGGAGGAPFNIQYAGHPCPSHSGSEHHCAMRCELLGICSAAEDAADALAEFVAGAVDVAKFEERRLDRSRCVCVVRHGHWFGLVGGFLRSYPCLYSA